MSVKEKRYQVFISSTFEDLREERRAVQDVIISTGDFPVQMEDFPAADQDQFEFIRSLIEECDYYVLIIGGRYGTPTEDGLSYTHKEFRYAVSKSVPILVMLHGNRGAISVDKSERTSTGKTRLNEFIKEAETGRLRKTWTTKDELKLRVREALDHAKATKPRTGWVRGDSISSLEALEELNEVRKENERIRAVRGNLTVDVPMPDLPPIDDIVRIQLLPAARKSGGRTAVGSSALLGSTWISVFPLFFSNLQWAVNDRSDGSWYVDQRASCQTIGSALAGELAAFDTTNLFKLSPGSFDTLQSYYTEAGLMRTGGESPFTEIAQQVARRHRIQGTLFKLSLLDGDLSEHTLRGGDDDIPF